MEAVSFEGVRFCPVDAAGRETVERLSAFAGKIVREHFDPIIGPEQNRYMIARFQSPASIARQIAGGCRYYILEDEGRWAGFLAFYPDGDRMYLSKFYLDRAFRGRKLSGKMFRFVCREAEREGLSAVYLHVNRFNDSVIAVYRHFGFHVVRKVKQEIGSSFIMDDYQMERPLPQGETGEWLWMTETADGLDREAFLSVFKESTLENLPQFYPGLPQPEAMERYEADFWDYICGDFQKEGGILALLVDDGGYRASLRLYPQGGGTYAVEALETRPDSRRMGYGKRLYRRVIARLEAAEGEVRLRADTGRNNRASIAAHLSAGFQLAPEDPEHPGRVNLIYQTR